MITSRSNSEAISSTSSSGSDCVAVRISFSSFMRYVMIRGIGTPSACERSRTVTPDCTVTGPVGGAVGCCCFGRASWRSRAARASRWRAAPPSITTRRLRPELPPRGRIGRLGLLGPLAMAQASV
jgi:hypothetical protein